MKKKFYVIMLASSLFLTSIPVSAGAATQVTESAEDSKKENAIKPIVNDSTDKGIEKQLTKILPEVKKKITIPKDCTKFESNFYTEWDGYGTKWNLSWYNEDGTHTLYVISDEYGNILNYNEQENNSEKEQGEVKYLIEELRPIADAFIKKTAPELTENLSFQTAVYLGTYNNCYQFEYIRTENGIVIPDNSIQVQVSAEDKKVHQYNANWTFQLKIPAKNIQLSKEQATQKIKTQVNMELKYMTKWSEKDSSQSAYLVYMPSQRYISIDAETGEVYTSRQEWRETEANEKEDSLESAAGENADGGLTKEELAQIEELGNLISREQAIEKVMKNPNLYLEQNATAITAALYRYGEYGNQDQKQYIWNISIKDLRKIADKDINFRAYSNASVDAKTGEIISFFAGLKRADEMTPEELEAAKKKASKEKCQSVLEAFAKSQNAKQFVNTKQSFAVDDYEYDYDFAKKVPVYGGYAFRYSRTNENIPYEDNYFSGSVDAISGKIFQYKKIWNETIKFESSKNAMTKEQAFEKYMQLDGYGLVYEINTIYKIEKKETQNQMYPESDAYSVEYQPRLVYSTNIYPSMISPFTGKQLNWNGEEYEEYQQNITGYTDVKGNQYERSILLLRDLGAGCMETEFRPNEAITSKELTTMAERIITTASMKKYQLKDSKSVTREQMAKYGVQIMGYDTVAKLGNIFRCGYTDDEQIGEEYYNYVAIAKGLGLFGQNIEETFSPASTLTRGEAANLLIQILNSERG